MFRRHSRTGIVHIPKTAGTSLRIALDAAGLLPASEQYHDPYISGFHDPYLRRDGWDQNVYSLEELRSALRSNRVVMGHVGVGTFLQAGASKCIVLIREPRSRLLSLFDHFQRLCVEGGDALPSAPIVEAVASGLGCFLASESIDSEVDNVIYRMVLPTAIDPSSDPHLGETDPVRLRATVRRELRKHRGRFLDAVWSEDLDRSIQSVVAKISGRGARVSVPPVPHANMSPPIERCERIDAATRAGLERRTWKSSIVIDELMDLGILEPRSQRDLDREFAETARRHGFHVEH